MVPWVGSVVTPLEGNKNTDFLIGETERDERGRRVGKRRMKMLKPKEGEGINMGV